MAADPAPALHDDDVGEDNVRQQNISDETKLSSGGAACKRQLSNSAAGWGVLGCHNPTKRLKHARFLAFHRDMLGLLHKDDECLDPKIWKMIQNFLLQREQLLESKHRAGAMKDIHCESLRHGEGEAAWMTKKFGCPNSQAEERQGKNQASSNAATPQMRNLAPYHDANSVKPSPVLSRHTIRGSLLLSQHVSQNSPETGKGSGAMDHHNNSSSSVHSHNNNQFYVVARLLGRQHHIIESNFYQQAQPFQPLLASTVARIGNLQQELHQSQQRRWAIDHQRVSEALAVGERWSSKSSISNSNMSAAVDPPSPLKDAEDEENERSRAVTLESKIRLWSLLAQDLQEAILPGPDSATGTVNAD